MSTKKQFPHNPKVHTYEKPICPTCNEKYSDLHTTGANKFQNIKPPLVYHNMIPHKDAEHKEKITLDELKQTHK